MTKNDLTANELMLLQSELNQNEKSSALAYLMLLGGHLGVHRFYLKRFVTGSIQLGLFFCALISYIVLLVINSKDVKELTDFTWFPLVFMLLFGLSLFIWIVIDACNLGRYVKEWNQVIEQKTIEEILSYRKN
jgi:hypothetical protein